MRNGLEAIGVALLALLGWITWSALYGPNPLPERIPTHFMANGQPNAWGPPAVLWLLPAVAAFVYLLISVVGLFPGSFNFPVRATPASRPRLEALTIRMIQSVRAGHAALSPIIVPVFLVVVFGTVIAHLVAVFRAARAGSGSR